MPHGIFQKLGDTDNNSHDVLLPSSSAYCSKYELTILFLIIGGGGGGAYSSAWTLLRGAM